MKKIICQSLIVLFFSVLLSGCSMEDAAKDKVSDMEYTVVPDEDIPEEVKSIIEEKKKVPFQFSYAAGDDLFIVVGYGEQKTGGYSITVEELYTTENSVVISTNLMGPDKDEKVEELATYPYIAVKTEYIDKTVTFQ